ncbi:ankyrin [Ophiobolus disseminans]|uniref:Ankyrin n=1 Tax=Ophiobolus disseminans TaxID=1469910 RepID=A0A6A6ZFM0_9PLEO|nr:ankyrin [Ophiobolus disseminans]
MAEPTMADLKDIPALYTSSRGVGDVLVGQDAARRLIEASSSGNDTALWSLLSQPQYVTTMLDKPHVIYSKDPRGQVLARPISNLERALTVAAQNGHATVVATLLAFATEHSVELSDVITRAVINKTIDGGHAAIFEALAAADPNVINIRVGHGHERPLYEAVRRRKPDVVAALLELGADPLHPVAPGYRELGNFRSSLMSFAAMNEGPRTTTMLLERGTPIKGTAALHTAARFGQLDTMRLLMHHGADLEENVPGWKGWTPMHFAASTGKVDAMKLLEQHGARKDSKDEDGKTPAQLLEEQNTA